jgi:hypothetical protein
LICPQCKGRFTAPADDGPETDSDDPLPLKAEEPEASSNGSDTDFLANLSAGSAKGPSLAAPSPARPAAKSSLATVKSPSAGAGRAAASRAKKQSEQMMMIYIGGGIGAALLLIVVIAIAASSGTRGPGVKKDENIRFGLKETERRKLFKELITAVDENGISKECKAAWYGIADKYKLSHSNIKDVLDEGFRGGDWEQPAPAHVTNQNRGIRMEWTAKRTRSGGSDPILGM